MSQPTLATDILQPLPLEKWSLLLNKTKCNWPKFAHYHYWIENSIQWKKKDPNLAIQIYCPYGNYEENAFIGIANFSLDIVIIFTLNPNDGNIIKALVETKVIDWTREVYFAGVHESVLPTLLSAVEKLKSLKHIEIRDSTPANIYIKSAEDCANVEICVPNECYIKSLDKLDVELIHSEWPHKEEEHADASTKFISTIVEMNGGVGLYLEKNNCLVSWALHNDWSGLGMVQTLEEHKRKGYAKVVVNTLAKQLGKQGISPTLFVVEGNVTSETMFQNLGWNRVASITWIILKGKEKKDTAE